MATLEAGIEPAAPSRTEDREMLAAAAAISRDFGRVKPWIYWTDLLLTAGVAYGAFAGALLLPFGVSSSLSIVVCMLAFYRGISFIHELTHIKSGSLRGFRTAWNLMIGIPLLVPSFMYDDVHTLHHARTSYGTVRDPEYLPLASMRATAVIMFVVVSALAPLGLLIRFAVLSPLSFVSSRIRRSVMERYSALAINPAFRRRPPTGAFRREWIVLEAATSVWATALIILALTDAITLRSLTIGFAIGAGVAVINQVRTLAAHLWENEDGLPMTLTDQYLDSVNVPPPATLPALWAPVGLRYHGLHHLLPSVPYHNLGKAHRRLANRLASGSSFYRGNHARLRDVLRRLFSAPALRLR
jgi:fatty acid desaturase